MKYPIACAAAAALSLGMAAPALAQTRDAATDKFMKDCIEGAFTGAAGGALIGGADNGSVEGVLSGSLIGATIGCLAQGLLGDSAAEAAERLTQ